MSRELRQYGPPKRPERRGARSPRYSSPLACWQCRSKPKRSRRGKVHRIGILTPAGRPTASTPGGTTVIVPTALRELGYVEGKNLVVERRFAEGKIDRLPALARELVGLRVDVIVAVSAGAVQAAMGATKTIPIVMIASDPVGHGLVANLARPGGNVTGVATVPEADLVSKRLSLIKEAVPRVPRIAVLTTDERSARTQVEKARQTAPSLGIKLVVLEIRDTAYDRTFNLKQGYPLLEIRTPRALPREGFPSLDQRTR
jgi:ABC transporter substrate binding protein